MHAKYDMTLKLESSLKLEVYMNKLSPLYRNDTDEGIDPELRDYLDGEFFQKLEHIKEVNPKVLVVFAGGNAVGKSTLSAKIAEELHGIRLENDGVKRAVLRLKPELAMTDELHNITWRYTMNLYKRLSSLTNNGLVIRDGIITWYYDRILPIFEAQGYTLFIIGYNLSEEKMRELIAARGDTPTSTAERFYQLIPDQKIHLKRFFNVYTADVMLDDASVFDHEKVLAALKLTIARLKS